ncbi:MAG: hypothetical protein OHK0040_06940 [bacterium]
MLIPDIVIKDLNKDDMVKITFAVREEVASVPSFSVISRSNTQKLLASGNGNGNGNGISYMPDKDTYLNKLSDLLLRKDIDFAFYGELKKSSNVSVMEVYLLNHESILYQDRLTLKESEDYEPQIKQFVKNIFGKFFLGENEVGNVYEYDEMVFVPGGNAIIGSNFGEPFEAPERTVFVQSFYIDKYEVTNAQYKRFVDATKREAPKNVVNPDYTIWKNGTFPEELANHPVVNVTWYDAKAYCEWAGKRLPTAIEWEKAARGPYGNVYPWGNEFFQGYANLYTKGVSYKLQQTVPVGTYEKSKSYYGAYDMAGNAWEWTASVPPNSKEVNDIRRVAKGGGWGYNGNKYTARASYSIFFTADYTSNCLGFRCVR